MTSGMASSCERKSPVAITASGCSSRRLETHAFFFG